MSKYVRDNAHCKYDANNLYYKKENFVILEGTIPAENSQITISYPEGFTVDNCVVLSQMLKASSNKSWFSNSVFNLTSLTQGSIPNLVRLDAEEIKLQIRGLCIMESSTTISETFAYDLDYKIVLMKVV